MQFTPVFVISMVVTVWLLTWGCSTAGGLIVYGVARLIGYSAKRARRLALIYALWPLFIFTMPLAEMVGLDWKSQDVADD